MSIIWDKGVSWDAYFKKGAHFERVKSPAAKNLSKLISPGSKVLDLPCATGRNSIIFAKMGFKVWGADISTEAIGRAKKSHKHKNLRFLITDYRKMKFSRNFFDSVFINGLIEIINNFGELKKAVSNVLKVGGILYFSEAEAVTIDDKTTRLFSRVKLLKTFKSGYDIIFMKEYKVKHPADFYHPAHAHKILEIAFRRK